MPCSATWAGVLRVAARPGRPAGKPRYAHHDDAVRRHRWARRVSDVMTTTVVTVDRITPYQEIDRLLTRHRIDVALMTSPAITIGPDATIPAAARLMTTDHVSRLPVVDEKGRLVGVVSRRDLLSVFLRPDDDIARDARQVLDELPLADPKDAIVRVKHGVVTLAGTIRPGS